MCQGATTKAIPEAHLTRKDLREPILTNNSESFNSFHW